MIHTQLTSRFLIKHPVVLAPMGSVSGGTLAAAVSNAGGLGLIGAGYGDPEWLSQQLALFQQASQGEPWGVGFITWAIEPDVLQIALTAKPSVIMLSFGDPRPYADDIHRAGSRLICQVQDLAGAKLAQEAGAAAVVAQGSEGGGHGGKRGSLSLIPAVVDLLGPSTPVIAAGGLADGRGLAAALMLGAQGVLMGTRFYASQEALGHQAAKQKIVEASGDHTMRTHVFDIVRGYKWPDGHTGRALQNRFLKQWHGSESALVAEQEQLAPAFWEALEKADYDTAMVWAGEVVDLIASVDSAAQIIERVVQEAAKCLANANQLLLQDS